MPIYEYVCQSCQHRFEVKQGIKDPPVASCERCGQAVSKIISPSAIMFKGTGWYITDYSDKLKPKPDSKGEEKSPAPAQKNGDSSSSTTSSGTSAGTGSSATAAAGTSASSSTK